MSVHSICSCVVLSCSAISSLLHCWKRTWENHHNMMHVICAATSTHITATAVSRGAQQVSIKSSSSVKNLYFTGTPSGRVRERAALLLNSSSYMSELASCCARLTCTGAISSKASSSRCFDNWTILSQVQVLMWGLFSLYYILINISIYFFLFLLQVVNNKQCEGITWEETEVGKITNCIHICRLPRPSP